MFVGALAGILIGFGLFGPSQGYFLRCAAQPCFDQQAASRPVELKAAGFASDDAAAKPAPAAAATTPSRPSRKHRRIDLAGRPPPQTKSSVRATEPDDPVLEKARLSIAAKLENPASAEFADMNRAVRLNTFGRAVDTICGHVRAKNASGEDTGDRPFLYLVKEDDVYLVDCKTDSAAAIAYRNICK